MTGGIPSEFGRLQSLVSLYLGGSGLNGTIPTEIGMRGHAKLR